MKRGTRKSNFWHIRHSCLVGKQTVFEWEEESEEERKKGSLSWRKSLTKKKKDTNCGSNIWFSRKSPHVKRVADDTDWSDFADLITNERVHLANETSNLVKHYTNETTLPWIQDVWFCNKTIESSSHKTLPLAWLSASESTNEGSSVWSKLQSSDWLADCWGDWRQPCWEESRCVCVAGV